MTTNKEVTELQVAEFRDGIACVELDLDEAADILKAAQTILSEPTTMEHARAAFEVWRNYGMPQDAEWDDLIGCDQDDWLYIAKAARGEA